MGTRSARALLAATLWAGGMSVLAIPSAEAAPPGCEAGVESDFNGDGYSDAVAGDPYATVSGEAEAGRVVVLYGDSDGRIGEGARVVISQEANEAEAGDRFGFALAVADLNCDEYTDLVVGNPYEDNGSQVDAGYVEVVWGANNGLGTGAASKFYNRNLFGEVLVAGDQFGYAVDALEDAGGLVQVFPLTNLGAELSYAQSSPGIPGDAEAGERFGSALAVVSGVSERALIVGVPDDVGNSLGMVDVIPFGGGTPRAWVPGQNGVPSSGANRFGAGLPNMG